MEIKTTWEYSLETEATRLIHCARQIAMNFYRINNFIVLPYTLPKNNTNIVTFPDLPYNKIPRFWEKAKKINVYYSKGNDVLTFPLIPNKDFLDQTIRLIQNSKIKRPTFQKTKALWEKSQNKIIQEIYKIIPSKEGIIKQIKIHPTCFGTVSSFNFIDKSNGFVIIYLRENGGIWEITKAIISSLTRMDVYKNLRGFWQESELLTDWLVTHSSIAEVLKKNDHKSNFIPTLKSIRTKQQARLLKVSNEFYKKLGFPVKEKAFEAKNGAITIYGKPFENLTTRETEILKLLVKNQNKVVTTDDLADSVFANYDDFSLYAMSKTIERLRNKLEQNGLSGSYIQTLRGQGFILKN